MDKIKITSKKVKLTEITPNPGNPRTISEKNMDKLVKSLREFPEMMQLREVIVDEDMMILGGNMRFRALGRLGETDCVAKIVTGLTPEQKREFVIKDNAAFGEWDMDVLANDWDGLPLTDWGVDLPVAWSREPLEPSSGPGAAGPEEPQIIICPKCKHEFSVLREKSDG